MAATPFLAGVSHDRHALSGLEALRPERQRDARHQPGVLAPGALAVQPEVLGAVGHRVRLRTRARGEGSEDARRRRHQWRVPRKARTSSST